MNNDGIQSNLMSSDLSHMAAVLAADAFKDMPAYYRLPPLSFRGWCMARLYHEQLTGHELDEVAEWVR